MRTTVNLPELLVIGESIIDPVPGGARVGATGRFTAHHRDRRGAAYRQPFITSWVTTAVERRSATISRNRREPRRCAEVFN